MKAIFAVCGVIASTTLLPIYASEHQWRSFRAYTYAQQGHRLMAQYQWATAAQAFAKAFARDPSAYQYQQLSRIATALAAPQQRRRHAMPSTPLLALTSSPVPPTSDEAMLMAIIPASGSTQQLKPDEKGQYWGPMVRIAYPQPATPSAVTDVTENELPLPKTRVSPSDAELAYAALQDRDFAQARSLFARAIAADPRPQWIADRRPLNKWLHLQSGMTFRQTISSLAASQAILGQGGGWFDATVRLNGNPDRPLTFTAFLYGTQPRQQLGFSKESLQAGFGVRWQPVHYVTVEAARLVKIGDQARDDWMLRAGAGMGAWRPADSAQTYWLHWQARADAAVIGLKQRDIFGEANGRVGLGVRLNDELSLTPYIAGIATVQKDRRTATLVELSPGLWLHRNGTLPLDARLEYRHKIAGNAAASNGVAVTFGLSF